MKTALIVLILAILPASILPAASNGSLWGRKGAGKSMYADAIAGQIGDIVTIVVQEKAQISASTSSSTSKESSLSNQIEDLLKVSTDNLGMAWNSQNDFEGGGEISNSQSAQSRMSVVVIDKLPNGNLVIEGMRKVTMADEVNYAVLRGYIRPMDIRADNSIYSSQIADAQIEYVGEGTLTEAQRIGWLNRIYSFLNPF